MYISLNWFYHSANVEAFFLTREICDRFCCADEVLLGRVYYKFKVCYMCTTLMNILTIYSGLLGFGNQMSKWPLFPLAGTLGLLLESFFPHF